MSCVRQLRLEWTKHQGSICLEINGWTETELSGLGGLDAGDTGRRLALYPSEALAVGDGRHIPPVAGRFTLERETVRFVPRFPFVDGMSYSLLVYADDGVNPEIWDLRHPCVSSTREAEVQEIYPTAQVLPVNLLRMYIHFSAPMSEGWAGHAVRVCREDTDETVEGVFLPPEPELWAPGRQRLTMLLDPGRIKRGLVPNVELGYPLVEGVPVRVTIDTRFRDAAGQPLIAGLERRYQIGPALGSRLEPCEWRLTTPPAGSQDPLVVDFDRPLDHGLLLHGLWVRNAEREIQSGTVEPGAEEHSWRFTPSSRWEHGDYQLVIDPHLEDVAGNSPVRVFDRDVSVPEDAPREAETLSVGFSCVSDVPQVE